MVNYEPGSDSHLDAVFGALAHPARRTLLARLSRGEASVGELALPLDMSLPAVTKHLKVLEKAQLIHRRKDAQWRLCRLETAPLKEAHDWIGEQRKVWEARLDRLEHYLHSLEQDDGGTHGKR